MITTKDFYYDLPPELIAQTPLADRSASKLMVVNRETGEVRHRHFRDIVTFLRPGDCLVMNNTRVIPARLYGEKEGTGGKIEFLLLRRIDLDTWEVILKPGKKAKPGSRFVFGGGLVNMGELLFGRVRQVFDSYCHTEEPVEFLFAQCGQEAGLLGALELLF